MSNKRIRSLHPLRRAVRSSAFWLVCWSRRHTIALWARSWWSALRERRVRRPSDVKALAAALLRVSGDARLANAPEIRRVGVVDDGIVADVDPSWHRRELLRTVLGGSSGVTNVAFVSTPATQRKREEQPTSLSKGPGDAFAAAASLSS